jgi:hypothetical protein
MENIKMVAILSAFMLLIGCESFTEVDTPQNQLVGKSVFNDVSTANASLADIYARMREGGMVSGIESGLSSLMGNYADELSFYGPNDQLMQFNNHTLVPSNSLVANLWNTTYSQIYATNALLEGTQKSSNITGADKNRLIGEALFIRAYLHFYLVNIFGSVPYITTTDYNSNSVAVKLPEQEVYARIKEDLVQAQNILPETYPTNVNVRPNKAVVTALMARVYLYTENWSQAEIAASAVINNPLYTWQENPANVFLKGSPEIIWSLHPGIAGLNTKDARTFVFTSGPPIRPVMSENLLNAFEPGDLRKQYWTRTITKGTNSWSHAFKYKLIVNTGTSIEHTILFRLAEQYLIRAEARLHLGDLVGAKKDLNKIRTRAALSETTANTNQSILDAILQERRIELFLEQGHRWFDLKRTDRAAAVLGLVKPQWQDTQVLLPLPENEILLNGNLLPQNPGY